MPSGATVRRFHFIKELASGGFGSVYLAKVMHPDGFSRLVAVKLLKTQWADSEEVARRTRDEARLLGMLRHKNIVDVLDLTSIDGRAAVIMEYIEAVDLKWLVDHFHAIDERLPPAVALEIVAIVSNALDAAYNRPPLPGDKPLRVIHRDIKPSNIMLDIAGMVKILDFGVARSDLEGRESNTQELQFGSVDYMAPERLFFEPETPASDVYSLAATLYEMLALEKLGKARGRPERHAAYLWDRLSFLRAHAGLSGRGASDLEALLRESLDYDHERRPTASEFAARAKAMAKAFGGEGLQAWAEAHMGAFIQLAEAEPRPPDSLTNSVLTEDSIVFRKVNPVVSYATPSEGEATFETTQLGADLHPADLPVDLRAADLPPERRTDHRLGGPSLSEPDESEVVVPSPVTGSPRAMARPSRLAPASTETGPRPVHAPPYQAPPLLAPHDETAEIADSPYYLHDGRPTPEPDDLPDPGPPTMQVDQEPEPATLVDANHIFRQVGSSSDSTESDRAALMLDATSEIPYARADTTDAGLRPRSDEISDDADTADDNEVTDVAPGDAVPDAPARPRSGIGSGLGYFLMAVAALLAGTATVGAFLVVYALDVGGVQARLKGLALDRESATDPVDPAGIDPAQVDPAAADPNGADPGVDPVASGASGITFTSLADGTTKLTVRCTGGNAKGDRQAMVPLSQAATCTVTAILADRNRISAVVNDVQAGTYACFPNGEATCR